MMRCAAALALAVALGGCAGGAEQAATGRCEISKQADVAIDTRANQLLVPARIAGEPVTMILDTGSERSLVTPSSAAHLRLPHVSGSTTVVGVGGNVQAQNVILQGLEFGSFGFPAVRVPVTELAAAVAIEPPVAGLIGGDVLSAFDLDLDFPHHRLTLYNVSNCAGAFLPWTGPYATVPLLRTRSHRFLLPVEVDGHRVNALFDTGANAGRMTRDAALTAGATPAALDHDPGGHGSGVGGRNFRGVLHRFADVAVGPEHFRQVAIAVVDLPLNEADMLLGMDYMRSRRIWLSYATRQAFIQSH